VPDELTWPGTSFFLFATAIVKGGKKRGKEKAMNRIDMLIGRVTVSREWGSQDNLLI
jgi:hypothetical protein